MRTKNKRKKIRKIRFGAAILAAAFLTGIFYLTPVKGIVAQKLAAEGSHYFNGGAYDLDKAAKWYKIAAFVDHKSSTAHYQLARVYFVQNKLREAKSEIDQAISHNADSNRAYYIKGLIDGYSKNYPEAIVDFSKFIERSPEEWAGYNDLAWAYYENKDYENARTTLEKGLEVKPENPWLLNGLGAALLALKEYSMAEEVLNEASQAAGKVTASEWEMAYPGNDPSLADWDLADFKGNIKFNQSLAYDKSPQEAIIVPACQGSCQFACGMNYDTCNLYWVCSDPDHGGDIHGLGGALGPDRGGPDQWAIHTYNSPVCCPSAPAAYCGDGSCNDSENCSWCPQDCGGCPPPPPVNGACNYNTQTFCPSSFPSGSLCGSGSQDGPYDNGSSWGWNCWGYYGGGSQLGCWASKLAPFNPQCGGSNRGSYCNQSQITSLCSTGTASAITATGSGWTWNCADSCYGGSVPCSASKLSLVTPACGSASGKTFCKGAPSSNLCASGTASSPTGGTGYQNYTWTCIGQCDGPPVTCSAKGQGYCGWIETNP